MQGQTSQGGNELGDEIAKKRKSQTP